MDNIKRYLKLYKIFIGQQLKTQMAYPIDFLLGMTSFLLTEVFGIVFLNLVFSNIPSLNGYTFEQLLFIYGFILIPKGLDHIFTDNLWIMANNGVVKGDIDRYLTRPINPLMHLLMERFQLDGTGELITGLCIVTYASIALNLNYNLIDIIVLIILSLFGALIITSIKLIFASVSLWTKRSVALMNLIYSLLEFGKYPLSIFNKSLQFILMFIIPFAFASSIPSSYFLSENSLNHELVIVSSTVLVAIITFSIGYFIFKQGLKAYESAGS